VITLQPMHGAQIKLRVIWSVITEEHLSPRPLVVLWLVDVSWCLSTLKGFYMQILKY
jgi:hypothetical protein